jgi:phospholipid N-methyltransferase
MSSTNLRGSVDVLKETEISGWAANPESDSRQVFVEILVNSTPVASVRGCLFRQDLFAAGIGDGRKAFRFDPRPYLAPGKNMVEVRYAGSGDVLPHGHGELAGFSQGVACTLEQPQLQRLLAISQERWKGDEADVGLTWGQIFTGDSFVDALQKHHQFSPDHDICEIGPGYGRLLKTILERSLPFRTYTGVELSAERVRKLTAGFGSDRVEFVQADAAVVRLSSPCDLVFSSSTFEHLFPDCSSALKNLSEYNLKDGGRLAIDFIQADPDMSHQSQNFEDDGHAFVRTYSAQELRDIFRVCGLSSLEIASIVLGQAAFGPVRRIFTFSSKPFPNAPAPGS